MIDALEHGDTLFGQFARTARNPWLALFCGPWIPLKTIVMICHFVVIERASCNLIGHVRISGVRPDLAQMALIAEACAHVLAACVYMDPFVSFHWGWMPAAMFTSLMAAAMILSCGSTLLLAGYWHQMISNNGLASVACESNLTKCLAATSGILGIGVGYGLFVEVRFH